MGRPIPGNVPNPNPLGEEVGSVGRVALKRILIEALILAVPFVWRKVRGYRRGKEGGTVRGRFGRLALVVGALATIIIAWLVRRRVAADAIRESYETARERIRVARERARERLGERVRERGPREEMRSIIRESVRRSRGEA